MCRDYELSLWLIKGLGGPAPAATSLRVDAAPSGGWSGCTTFAVSTRTPPLPHLAPPRVYVRHSVPRWAGSVSRGCCVLTTRMHGCAARQCLCGAARPCAALQCLCGATVPVLPGGACDARGGAARQSLCGARQCLCGAEVPVRRCSASAGAGRCAVGRCGAARSTWATRETIAPGRNAETLVWWLRFDARGSSRCTDLGELSNRRMDRICFTRVWNPPPLSLIVKNLASSDRWCSRINEMDCSNSPSFCLIVEE